VQDPALGLIELHEVHTGQVLELIRVPLVCILSLEHINCTTLPAVIHKLAEDVLNPTMSLMKIVNSTGPDTDP